MSWTPVLHRPKSRLKVPVSLSVRATKKPYLCILLREGGFPTQWALGEKLDVELGTGEHQGLLRIISNEVGMYRLTQKGARAKSVVRQVQVPLPGLPAENQAPLPAEFILTPNALIITLPSWTTPSDLGEKSNMAPKTAAPQVDPKPAPDIRLKVTVDNEVARRMGLAPGKAVVDNRKVSAKPPLPAKPGKPVPPPPPRQSEAEQQQIDAHIAAHGVTRAVDFGPHNQPIAWLRGCAVEVLGGKPNGAGHRVWLYNGAPVSTEVLYERINRLRKERGLPYFVRSSAGAERLYDQVNASRARDGLDPVR